MTLTLSSTLSLHPPNPTHNLNPTLHPTSQKICEIKAWGGRSSRGSGSSLSF